MLSNPNVIVVPKPVSNASSNETIDSNIFENLNETDFVNPNGSKINWEGEEIPEGPWIDRELFKIGDISITNKDVVIGTGTIIIIVLVVFGICSYISWRKRKEIAQGVRRLSTAVRRLSTRIRKSISGKGNEDIKPGMDT